MITTIWDFKATIGVFRCNLTMASLALLVNFMSGICVGMIWGERMQVYGFGNPDRLLIYWGAHFPGMGS